jgi:hypothetical protein
MTKRGSVLGQETFAIRCKGEVVATPCVRARDDIERYVSTVRAREDKKGSVRLNHYLHESAQPCP